MSDYARLNVADDNPYLHVLRELTNMPFYKVDGGYKYGGRLLHSEEKCPYLSLFLNDETQVEHFGDISLNTSLKQQIDRLCDLFVSDESLDVWNISHKATDDIKAYHTQMQKIKELLFAAMITNDVSDLNKRDYNSNEIDDYKYYANDDMCQMMTVGRSCIVLQPFETEKQSTNSNSGQTVLNHKNPFADISIKEQSFVYGSSFGQFETLQMVTSHMLTKVENDTETSFITMQPGFKIQKDRDCIAKECPSVIFDDTISSKLTEDENECYVYIN